MIYIHFSSQPHVLLHMIYIHFSAQPNVVNKFSPIQSKNVQHCADIQTENFRSWIKKNFIELPVIEESYKYFKSRFNTIYMPHARQIENDKLKNGLVESFLLIVGLIDIFDVKQYRRKKHVQKKQKWCLHLQLRNQITTTFIHRTACIPNTFIFTLEEATFH